MRLVVQGIPPSVNHYKVPTVRRGHLHWYLTPEAKAFKRAVAIVAEGRTIAPDADYARDTVRYALSVVVYLGKGQRGDGDNFLKCIADGLVDANVIHSDARVKDWHLVVEDSDRSNPRTEITIEVL